MSKRGRKSKKEGIKSKSKRVKENFKTHTVAAITAAFAFIIVLSWRTPIQHGVDNIINRFGLQEGAIYIEILTAAIITIIAILVLMLFSGWESKNE